MNWTTYLLVALYGLAVGWLITQLRRKMKRQKEVCTFLKANEFMAVYKKNQLIDVRTKEEYKYEHILGARNIPHNKIRDAHTLLHRDKPVYLYCKSGKRAKRAAKSLIKQDFQKIIIMKDNLENFTGKMSKRN